MKVDRTTEEEYNNKSCFHVFVYGFGYITCYVPSCLIIFRMCVCARKRKLDWEIFCGSIETSTYRTHSDRDSMHYSFIALLCSRVVCIKLSFVAFVHFFRYMFDTMCVLRDFDVYTVRVRWRHTVWIWKSQWRLAGAMMKSSEIDTETRRNIHQIHSNDRLSA